MESLFISWYYSYVAGAGLIDRNLERQKSVRRIKRSKKASKSVRQNSMHQFVKKNFGNYLVPSLHLYLMLCILQFDL